MARYEGLIARAVTDLREQFRLRLNQAIAGKEVDGKLPRGELAKIAASCGVQMSTLKLWRDGAIFPSDTHLQGLIDYFGGDAEKFLGQELARYYIAKGT
jgi:hypothetical protein